VSRQPDPFAKWPAWARDMYAEFGRDERAGQRFIRTQVQPWLTKTFQNLAEYQQNLTQGYQDFLAGINQLGQVAGAISRPDIQGTSGPISGSTDFAVGPSQEAARTWGSVAQAIGQNEALNTAFGIPQLGAMAASQVAAMMGDTTVRYQQRRDDFRAKIEDFLEQRRRWAIERMDAERERRFRRGFDTRMGLLNLLAERSLTPYQAGQLDLESRRLDLEGRRVDIEGRRVDIESQRATNEDLPTPNELKMAGYVPLPKKAGPKWRNIAVKAKDGSLWIKPGQRSGRKPSINSAKVADTVREWAAGREVKLYDPKTGKPLIDPKTNMPMTQRVGAMQPAEIFRRLVGAGVAPAAAYRAIVSELGVGVHPNDVYDALTTLGYKIDVAQKITKKLTGRYGEPLITA
jgi:hypothetical protein